MDNKTPTSPKETDDGNLKQDRKESIFPGFIVPYLAMESS